MPQPSASDCSICLGVPQSAVTTHCNHRFCEACIQSWISAKQPARCPVCRAELRLSLCGVRSCAVCRLVRTPRPPLALRAAKLAVVAVVVTLSALGLAHAGIVQPRLCRVLVYDHAASCSSPGAKPHEACVERWARAGSSRAQYERARALVGAVMDERATRGGASAPRVVAAPTDAAIHALANAVATLDAGEHDGATAVRARCERWRGDAVSWRHTLAFLRWWVVGGGGIGGADASPPPIAELGNRLIADFIGEGDDRDADTRLMRAVSPDGASDARVVVDAAPPTRAERAAALLLMAATLERVGGGAPSAKTTRWLRRAADAGSPSASAALGARLERGAGEVAAAEPAAARVYYEGAARAGDTGAALRLGLMLAEGRGGDADAAAAREWWRRGATDFFGDIEGGRRAPPSPAELLADHRAPPPPRDKPAASTAHRVYAARCAADAAYNLARWLEDTDASAAARWFAAAGRANRGGVGGGADDEGVAVLLANASLGAMILDGRGVRGGPDAEAALVWLAAPAAAGDLDSIRALGDARARVTPG